MLERSQTWSFWHFFSFLGTLVIRMPSGVWGSYAKLTEHFAGHYLLKIRYIRAVINIRQWVEVRKEVQGVAYAYLNLRVTKPCPKTLKHNLPYIF